MKEQGLCDKGITLQPYGFVEGIDLQQFHPDLDKFLRNYGGPHVIFTEYIPSMRRIDPELYTEKRMKNLVSGLREIHQASVVKSFLSRRDMFIIENDPERVVWVHFHHAKTYGPNDPAADVKIRWEDMKISRLAETMVSSNSCDRSMGILGGWTLIFMLWQEHYNVYGVLGDHWFHLDYM